MIQEAIGKITELLIQKDIEVKKNDENEYIKIKRTDLYCFCIKLLKILEEQEELKFEFIDIGE